MSNSLPPFASTNTAPSSEQAEKLELHPLLCGSVSAEELRFGDYCKRAGIPNSVGVTSDTTSIGPNTITNSSIQGKAFGSSFPIGGTTNVPQNVPSIFSTPSAVQNPQTNSFGLQSNSIFNNGNQSGLFNTANNNPSTGPNQSVFRQQSVFNQPNTQNSNPSIFTPQNNNNLAGNSVFQAKPAATNSIFNTGSFLPKTSTPTSVFSQPNNNGGIFNPANTQNPSQSIFSPQNNNNPSIFATPTNNSIFNTQGNTNSIYNNQTPKTTNPTPSIFSQPLTNPNTNQSSVFSPQYSTQTNTGIFANNSGSIFKTPMLNNQNPSSIFQTPPKVNQTTPQSIFNQPKPSIFQQPPSIQNSIFQPPNVQSAPSTFSKDSGPTVSVFNMPSPSSLSAAIKSDSLIIFPWKESNNQFIAPPSPMSSPRSIDPQDYKLGSIPETPPC